MIKIWISDTGHEVNLPALFADTMRNLTGQNPVIKFEPSPSKGAFGSVTRDLAGVLTVYIHPNLDLNSIFEVFLHEAAHVKLHAPAIAKSNLPTMAADTYTNTARTDAHYQADESAADQLRAAWLDYANKNAWRIPDNDYRLSNMHPVIYKLMILKTYRSK